MLSPEWGFADWERRFGELLVKLTKLKIRSQPSILNEAGIVLIDSPGMIDSAAFKPRAGARGPSFRTRMTTHYIFCPDLSRGPDFVPG